MLFKLSCKRNYSAGSGILQFIPGDLTSTTSFKGEIYPLVILENSVAEGQRMSALISASGRISYSSPSFLRFHKSSFIEDLSALEAKDKLKGKLKAFSLEMTNILEKHRGDFINSTENILKSKGFIYEEDLVKEIFRDGNVATKFAVHKFLYEGNGWIKDGQWNLTTNGAGPYTLRAKWQNDLLAEAHSFNEGCDIEIFREKVKDVLANGKCFRIESPIDSTILRSLQCYADEFYVNALVNNNPFKKIVSEAFLGIFIIDSQAQARELLCKLGVKGTFDYSKPLLNSHKSTSGSYDLNKFNIHKETLPCNLETIDFGQLPVYLVDPIGTVEIDDGISVEYPNTLHVHVADPSDYVNGELENDAMSRAGSIYLPETKIPMLSKRITQMTTLKHSGIGTMTFSCKVDLVTGELTDHKIRKGIINNLKHYTHEEAENVQSDPDIALIRQISNSHLNYRKSQGHFDFEFPRGIAKLDKEKELITIEKNARNLQMKKAVAEAMIIAGRIAGEYLRERGISGPFRNQESMTKTVSDAECLDLLKKYELLKGIPLASVASTPKRHASMALDAYVKVTSPLRRYLDLVTHKILKTGNEIYSSAWFDAHLNNICRQERYNKRLSIAVNRYWIERFLWQEQFRSQRGDEPVWTLTPLEKLKDGVWTVHVDQVATNFVAQIPNGSKLNLGEPRQGRILSKQWESILRFELMHA